MEGIYEGRRKSDKNHTKLSMILRMNKARRVAAAINSQANHFQLRARLFHCTPVSERRRRADYDATSFYRGSPKKFNQYHKRLKRQTMLRDVNEFAERLFQSWDSDRVEDDQSTHTNHSWFRPTPRHDAYKKGKSTNRASQGFKRRVEFCDGNDDVEFDNIFRSKFGAYPSFHWSFTMDYEPHSWSSSSYSSNSRASSGGKCQFDEEYEEYTSSSRYERPVDDYSDRLALGLNLRGPLKLEDVKSAYRVCALKWHPDRHEGSSKVGAEEKFKVCSAAYQSLCDKLALH